jgi:general secretion pathway protein L
VADWLLLRLPRAGGESASWLIADPFGAPLAAVESGPLAAAAPAAAGRRVCVLVPATDVLLAEPEVPAKAGAKLAQLVPYALEEHLADDVEELHFAVGRRVGDSPRVPTAVVARALIGEWLAALAAAGIAPECLYTDSELLPVNPGQAVALLEEDAVVVRPPGGLPVSLPADALAEALEIAQTAPHAIASHVAAAAADGAADAAGVAATRAPRGLIVYSGASEWQRHCATVEAVRGRFESVSVQLLADGPLALFAQQLPGTGAIDLLQGRYAPPSSRAVGLIAWRAAAMLLLGLAALHLAGKATELEVLKSRERQVDASIREAFHAAMPGDPGTLDARRRMEARLQALRGSGGSAGLLAALEALARARDAAAPGAQVKSLNFHDGSLELTLSAPDAASLDHISQRLRSSGWQADLVGGNSVGSAYEGRVQIRPQGS